jgi:tRNA dimethylallyltransferase
LEPRVNKSLIVICGPTAVGKTAISIKIAKALNTEIFSADSRQFYRELKIGVASPGKVELKAIKHHFIGHLSVADYYNVSRFENEIIGFLDNYFKSNNYALMVGGSGLYIDAVSKGIDFLPDPDDDLRKNLKIKLTEQGLEPLKQELKKLDPDYYQVVDLQNPNRIMRALEVCLMTGIPYSSFRIRNIKPRNFNIIKIGLDRPRAELFEKIEKRVDQMIAAGLVEEVKSLAKFRNLNSLNTVGYKEIFYYLDGNCSLIEAIDKIKTNTRHYAKRQLTWFKKDNTITWFHPEEIMKIIDFIEGRI